MTMRNTKSSEEKDLETLRREYRNMEVNRKTFAEESNTILRKQHQTLEKLRAENENIKTDVATLQARTTMKPLNAFEQSQLDKVTQEIERFKHLISVEKKEISSMEQKISDIREKIWNHRRKMGGTNAAIDNQRIVEKQVRILENRLDQAVVKFNKSLANNRKLREEIDNLRGERIAFEGVYKKLEKALQDRKRQMAHVIEQSNSAYEQRDKSRLEIVAIEQANKKEQEHFDRQMEEKEKALEAEISAAAERRKSQHPNVVDANEESKIVAEKAAKASALIREKEAQAKEREEKVLHYEDAFHKIKDATGVSDVDDLVERFRTNDEQNFSLFKFANEQTNEIETLEDQVQTLRLEQRESDSKKGSDQMKDCEQLKKIDVKIDLTSKQIEKITNMTTVCQKDLGSIQDGLKSLMTRLDCDVLDNDSELCINETNMLHYMGSIEEKTNTILDNYYRCKTSDISQKTVETPSVTNSEKFNINQPVDNAPENSQKQQKHSDTISVNPPKVLDYSSDEHSGDEVDCSRPLSIGEIKARALSRINQPRKKQEPIPLVSRRRSSILTRRRGSLLATPAVVNMKHISNQHENSFKAPVVI